MNVLLLYLYIQFGVALLFCLTGNLPGILVGLPLYGVVPAGLLIAAIRTKLWTRCPSIRKSDVVIASVAQLLFSAALAASVCYMFFPGPVARLFDHRMVTPEFYMPYFGLLGTVAYTLVMLPLAALILLRAFRCRTSAEVKVS